MTQIIFSSQTCCIVETLSLLWNDIVVLVAIDSIMGPAEEVEGQLFTGHTLGALLCTSF